MTSTTQRYVIGMTGLNASGKSCVSDFFKAKGFVYKSLSDAIREELKVRELPESRENLYKIGNELRNNEGPSTLGVRIVKLMDAGSNYIIDSVRHPEEIKALSKAPDAKFYMITVECPVEIRWERLKSRGRTGDCATLEAFLENEKSELKNPDPNGQQMEAAMAMSNFVISNDSTVEALEKAAQSTWEKISLNQSSKKSTPDSTSAPNTSSQTESTQKS